MSQTRQEAGTRAVRLGAIGGIVGPALFVVLVIIGGVLYNGYSHSGQKISELGGEGARYALLQNINFIVLGVLVIGFAWALGRVLGRPYGGAISIAIFGASSAIANGLLPCDTGCRGETTIGLFHNITGLTGFTAAIVGMFLLARRWGDSPYWKSHSRFTRTAALFAIAGLVAFVAGESTGVAPAFSGVTQRFFVGTLLLWLAATAVHLINVIPRSRQMAYAKPSSKE
ncbi:hypothetical protein BH23ACT4_BH23ACT4_14380 [soil metagenome]